ncbi:MAG: PH domain-containing protein [Actinomycetota bacterium]|nr:PH domain-containing protein [Actinomycetota bacterium]
MTLPTPSQPPAPTPTRSWGPRQSETALAAVGGLIMTALGFTVDPTGRWLVWAAAGLLYAIAALDLVVRPRLRADAAGLTVRSLTGQTTMPWAGVELRLRRTQRVGRTVPTLELDHEEKLIIFGRRELGVDPEEVLDQLNRLRTKPD